MIKQIRLHKFEIIIVLLISLIYFLIRLPNLTLQPIFADEAIYIRWAQVMMAEATLRFLPLTDGKTPLFMWAMIPMFKFFEDPLYAGRLLSVLSGFLTLLGALFLGWKFFKPSVGIWAAFLIAITPYTFFFDRMALVDTMLAAFTIWSLNCALLLMKYPRIDLAMVLGYIFGAGLLTKPPAFFNALVLPATLFIFNWNSQGREKRVLKIFGLWIVTIIITFAIYNILRLGPGFTSLNSRNQDYVFSPQELSGRWHDPFIPHFNDIADWFPKLLTPPILALIIVGAFLTLIKKNKIGLTILVWSLIPLMIQMAFLKTFTARYVFFSIPPLIVLGAYSIPWIVERIKFNKLVVNLAVALFLMPMAFYFNYLLITNPAKAPLPQEERRGYLEDWTAGVNLKEIAQFLNEQSVDKMVVIGTEGSFGTLPDGLQIYVNKNPKVIVIGGKAEITPQLIDAAKQHPTYFLANNPAVPQNGKNLKVIKRYPKITGVHIPPQEMVLYQLIPGK